MKALTTQFDNGKLSNTIATPTCCCCCCCCCCVASSTIATTSLATNIIKSCDENKISKNKKIMMIIAAICSIPVALFATLQLGYPVIGPISSAIYLYLILFPLLYFLIVLTLYNLSKNAKAPSSALILTVVFTIAFYLEFLLGMFALLNNPIIYLIGALLIVALYIFIKKKKDNKSAIIKN